MTSCRGPHATMAQRLSSATRQSGQALAEGLAVLGLMLLVCMAIAWLGRFQDMALSAQHASRHAAFQQTRTGIALTSADISKHYFSGPAHQWNTLRGQPFLGAGGEGVGVSIRRQALGPYAQPGGQGGPASALRGDWGIQDPGVLHVGVSLAAASFENGAAANSARLYLDSGYPSLHRHTAILTGAGHASGDAQVQQVLARSELAWGASASTSYTAGKKVAAIMNRLDSAWSRTAPDFDWLAPWAGRIPEHHLAPTGREAE